MTENKTKGGGRRRSKGAVGKVGKCRLYSSPPVKTMEKRKRGGLCSLLLSFLQGDGDGDGERESTSTFQKW